MRRTAFAVLFALAACSQPPAAPEAPAQTAAASAMTAAAPPAVGVPTPAMLVGRWGDNGDCSKDVVFNADGTFRSFTGGEGRWTLEGDVMTMTSAAGAFPARVAMANENTLMIGNPDGSFGISQRC